MKAQNIQSIAQVKVNFMKNEDKMREVGSKAYNRVMRDGSVSVVSELVDGLNLTMTFDEGTEDVTNLLKGIRVTLRFSEDQFEALNARFHDLGSIGALVDVLVDGDVEYGTLVANGVEVESYTIYVSEIQEVEPIVMQRVGSRDAKSAVLDRMMAHKAANNAAREQAIASRRPVLQTKAAQSAVPTLNIQ
jgi:hypothetical protein